MTETIKPHHIKLVGDRSCQVYRDLREWPENGILPLIKSNVISDVLDPELEYIRTSGPSQDDSYSDVGITCVKIDTYGNTPDEQKSVLKKQSLAYQEYMATKASQEVTIDLSKDKLCQACHFGQHCSFVGGDLGELIKLIDWIRIYRELSSKGFAISRDKDGCVSADDFSLAWVHLEGIVEDMEIQGLDFENFDWKNLSVKTTMKTIMSSGLYVLLNDIYRPGAVQESWRPKMQELGISNFKLVSDFLDSGKEYVL